MYRYASQATQKGRDLSRPYTYNIAFTNSKLKKSKLTTQKYHQNFNYTTIADRCRTDSCVTGVLILLQVQSSHSPHQPYKLLTFIKLVNKPAYSDRGQKKTNKCGKVHKNRLGNKMIFFVNLTVPSRSAIAVQSNNLGAFLYCHFLVLIFRWRGEFCHRTESDLILFLSKYLMTSAVVGSALPIWKGAKIILSMFIG